MTVWEQEPNDAPTLLLPGRDTLTRQHRIRDRHGTDPSKNSAENLADLQWEWVPSKSNPDHGINSLRRRRCLIHISHLYPVIVFVEVHFDALHRRIRKSDVVPHRTTLDGSSAARLDNLVSLLFTPGWACLMPATFFLTYGVAVAIRGQGTLSWRIGDRRPSLE
jgi:hypothetical protein